MNDVNKQYYTHTKWLSILSNCTMSFEQDKSYAIMGPSGSGKTTILKILSGIEVHDSGEVFLCSSTARERVRSYDISFVPQASVLFDELTVIENIMLASRTAGERVDSAKQNSKKFLDLFDLSHCAHLWPYQLSGGMKQRICLIQALVRRPFFVLADEPTAHLDTDSKQHVLQLLFENTTKRNSGLIIATHDPSIARNLDYILRLDKGKLYVCNDIYCKDGKGK